VTHGDFVEAIILSPKAETKPKISLRAGSSKPPLIVMPHGGPNSGFATDFMLYPACLAAMGFAQCLVNFTGSIGFGQDSIDGLVGKIGELDIADTHLCTMKAIEEGDVDQDAVFIAGGSHGGFITGHMIAKYPKLFKSGV
jgi:acylaminoacyl-peptidase